MAIAADGKVKWAKRDRLGLQSAPDFGPAVISCTWLGFDFYFSSECLRNQLSMLTAAETF